MTKPEAFVLIRHQSWFHPYVQIDKLPPFPVDELTRFSLCSFDQCLPKVLLGKGPFEAVTPDTVELFFEHGQDEYPVFRSLMQGPRGAALKMNSVAGKVEVKEGQAAFLLELSTAAEVLDEHVPKFIDAFTSQGSDDEFVELLNPLRQISQRLWDNLESLVGAYALYQPSLVWQRMHESQFMAFIHEGKQKGISARHPIHIPVLLDPSSRMQGGKVQDGVAQNISAIAQAGLHVPFGFLAESMASRDPVVRFLNYFWILEHLSVKRAGKLAKGAKVRQDYAAIEKVVESRRKKLLATFQSWESLVVKKDVINAISDYHHAIGIPWEEDLCRQSLRIRNKLSHGRPFDTEMLLQLEPRLGHLVRVCLRKELESRGIDLQ
jgi:hypothetical protein